MGNVWSYFFASKEVSSSKDSSPSNQNMADPVFSDAVNSASVYDKSHLKHVETREKNALPSQKAMNQEKQHQNFVDSINQDNKHNLVPVMTKDKIESMAVEGSRKSLVADISQVKVDDLRPTMTKEKVDNMKSDEKHESLVKGIAGYKKDELKHVEPQEKVSLPDAETVKEVKKHESLMSSIKQKDDLDLTPVMTRDKADSFSKEDMHQALSQEIRKAQDAKEHMRHIVTQDEVGALAQDKDRQSLVNEIQDSDKNKQQLRPTMTKEKVDSLKDTETHKGLVEGIAKTKRESLKHVEPLEKVVLPDAQTVEEVKKQENFLKSIQEDQKIKEGLRPVMTREHVESLSKDKGHIDLVKEIQHASKEDMRPIMTKEKAEDMKKDVYHKSIVKGIVGFEKDGLQHVQTTENIPLPDTEDINAEKELQKRLSDIETFNKSKLGHTDTKEKSVLPSKEDIIAEKAAES